VYDDVERKEKVYKSIGKKRRWTENMEKKRGVGKNGKGGQGKTEREGRRQHI
jgi:hypothetical protein